MPLKALFLLIKQFFSRAYAFFHFIYNTLWGCIKLWQLPYPRVTIFGGSRVLLESKHAREAHRLAELLVNNKIAILTGGGSGIMQAGTLGATHTGASMSLGVGARSISELCGNKLCAINYVEMDYLFSRKWILINQSQAFVAFPGGFGTINEIAEVLTYIQKGVFKKTPLILIGVMYWQPFIEWLEKSAIPSGLVDQNSKELIVLTDNIEEAATILIDYCSLIKAEHNRKDQL
jgi:uncharacterized protein (TIGR00730 family)